MMAINKANTRKFLLPFNLLLVVGSIILLASSNTSKPKQISAANFGAIPNDGKNDAEALQKAIAWCKANPGGTLSFAPGVYNFRDEKAVELMNGILTGKVKGNPQDSIFRPYYPYAKGLDFNGVRNITLEAAGATFLCEGWMEPVSLNNCSNIKIKGLTIDYNRKPNTEGIITEVQADWFVAEFDSIYTLNPEMSLRSFMFHDVKANRRMHLEMYLPRYEMLSPHRLKIFGKLDKSMTGNALMTPHTYHFRPAILMLDAKNIALENVTIHAQPGMGIVGHRSENIDMHGLRIVPNVGRHLSSNTDATHFTSCKGYIRYTNCQFDGHGDDAVNIHNYYLTIQKPAKGVGYDLVLKGADWHAQVLDYPDVADTMELVNKHTLAVVKKLVVKTVQNNIPELRSQVTFNEPLPIDIENYNVINVTRLPRVEITGCTVTNNRARGFLIKTLNVKIENNLIRNCTGTAIHVGAEGGCHEGPGSSNIQIRYNRIVGCGGGAGTIDGACGIAVSVLSTQEATTPLHSRILIEGNTIEGEAAENGISVNRASDVTIRYNEIWGCKTPVKVTNSEMVKVYSNQGADDFSK